MKDTKWRQKVILPLAMFAKAKKKYMWVYCQMSKKSRVGRLGLLLLFFFIIGKTGNSCSRFQNRIPVFLFRNFRTVTRPTLIFASDPMNFYTEFG
jgi:hypothetical protein